MLTRVLPLLGWTFESARLTPILKHRKVKSWWPFACVKIFPACESGVQCSGGSAASPGSASVKRVSQQEPTQQHIVKAKPREHAPKTENVMIEGVAPQTRGVCL